MSLSIADAIFWVAVACCTVAQLAILRSVIISPVRTAVSGAQASRWRRAGEITWAVIPGVALAFVLAATWGAMHGWTIVVGGISK